MEPRTRDWIDVGMKGYGVEADVGRLDVIMFAVANLQVEKSFFPQSALQASNSSLPYKHVIVGDGLGIDAPNRMLLEPKMLSLQN